MRDESGNAAIEYSVIAALMTIAIIISMQLLGHNLSLTFMRISNALYYALNDINF